MTFDSLKVQRTYIILTLLSTFAASFIWGINTLFLLDAGLSNTEAFAANAFFTLGQVIFEVPTGVVADVWGRRTSFLLGAGSLLVTTLLYLLLWQVEAPFWQWAVVSASIGLGFTFFSGATEAWLVDALHFTKYNGNLETVFAKGQIAGGVAMLSGSVAGGFIAQVSNLGVPYLVRSGFLALLFLVAYIAMRDIGFTPVKSKRPMREVRKVLNASIEHGWRNPPVRWLMLAAPFSAGVGIYAFYAMQPYLLQLYGDPNAYGVAGLAAAIVAGAQIGGGMVVPLLRRVFARRTTILALQVIFSGVALIVAGLSDNFAVAVSVLVAWGLLFALGGPIRQAFINALIPSKQRATVISFDSLMSSTGGVVAQPGLGKVADVNGYAASYVVSGVIQLLALPFTLGARRQAGKADDMK